MTRSSKFVMTIGKLRHIITLQKPKPGSDGITDDSGEWIDVATRQASIRPVSVKEIYAARGYLNKQDVVMTIRYEPLFDTIDNTWRILFRDTAYDVAGALNEGMTDRWLRITTHRDSTAGPVVPEFVPELLA